MSAKLSTAERLHSHEDDLDDKAELREIDALIRQCQHRMADVSEGILSSATKRATLTMYRDLRREAESKDVRSERLQWMEENVVRLQENIVKAAHEREMFEADLSQAVEKKWINKADVAKWIATFEDPNQLEMYRSQWLKEKWKKKFVAGWQSLAADREKVLARAAEAGVTPKDLPELGILLSDEQFLAEGRKFPARRSLVDTVDALITSAAENKHGYVRQMEATLAPASKGPDRCLHPAKVGEWLKKVAANPDRYTQEVMAGYLTGWRAARERYDHLAGRYLTEGKPDGCSPITVNAFLELPFEARKTVLAEWDNRLTAAKRMTDAEAGAFEKEKAAIRRSVDLKDLDAAQARLDIARAEHPDDTDITTIGAHIAVLREEQKDESDTREESQRTKDALRELDEVCAGLPNAIKAHYVHVIKEGNTEEAAALFDAILARANRAKSGRTSQHDEYLASLAAENAEDVAMVPERSSVKDDEEEVDETELLVTERTPPTDTLAMLKAHRATSNRSAALVVEGMDIGQHMQLVPLNERVMKNMRQIDSTGKGFKELKQEQETAQAA